MRNFKCSGDFFIFVEEVNIDKERDLCIEHHGNFLAYTKTLNLKNDDGNFNRYFRNNKRSFKYKFSGTSYAYISKAEIIKETLIFSL